MRRARLRSPAGSIPPGTRRGTDGTGFAPDRGDGLGAPVVGGGAVAEKCECLGKFVSVDDERDARDLVDAAVADG
jgi:hypothetical protein